jgi:hypothetical protein
MDEPRNAARSGREWGEDPALAEAAGINDGTARNYASVAQAFQLSCRRANLRFKYHQEAIGRRRKGKRRQFLTPLANQLCARPAPYYPARLELRRRPPVTHL